MPIDKMLGLRRPRLERVAVEKLEVATPDGLTIAAYAWGNPAGREIVFMHGYSQCYLSWRRQIEDLDLASEFRMVAYDLRGHGASSQPRDRELYKHDKVWADDLKAVIDAAGMKRPTLVAWSYAGRIVADYVKAHGQDTHRGRELRRGLDQGRPQIHGAGHQVRDRDGVGRSRDQRARRAHVRPRLLCGPARRRGDGRNARLHNAGAGRRSAAP